MDEGTSLILLIRLDLISSIGGPLLFFLGLALLAAGKGFEKPFLVRFGAMAIMTAAAFLITMLFMRSSG